MSAKPTAPAPSQRGSELAMTAERQPHRRDLSSLFDELQADLMRRFEGGPFGGFPFSRSLRSLTQLPAMGIPRVDVFERDDTLVVKAELPGVKREDIDLAIEGGDLVLRAERQAEREVKEEHWYRMERSSGQLYRRLPLPSGVTGDQIEAELRDGVLEITVPNVKPDEPAAQQIPIG